MIQAAQRVHQRLNLTSNIIIRDCVEDDLPHLEWFGWYTGFRDAIRATYRRQERGDASIIVADLQGFPIGQVWVEYGRRNIDAVGYIWALRVIPFLRQQRYRHHAAARGGTAVAPAWVHMGRTGCREAFARQRALSAAGLPDHWRIDR